MTSRPLLFLRSTGSDSTAAVAGSPERNPENPTLYLEEGMRIGWQGLYEGGAVMEWGENGCSGEETDEWRDSSTGMWCKKRPTALLGLEPGLDLVGENGRQLNRAGRDDDWCTTCAKGSSRRVAAPSNGKDLQLKNELGLTC